MESVDGDGIYVANLEFQMLAQNLYPFLVMFS